MDINIDTSDKIKLDSEALWQYSLGAYDQVKDLVLKLQDDYGLNVNLLLLSGYAQTLGCAIDEFDMHSLVTQTKQWQTAITKPYRELRRELKDTITSQQYQAMLTVELALEREEQWRLTQCLPELPPHNVEAQANILSCLIVSGVPLELLSQDDLASLYAIGQRVEH
ncbi:TIGR02444 family protein [Psychrobium sp. nBUS_13]|uniref:TIGR02444 family protein n=1 Tax=Psychrobium sp. nBUS_13 TaxID=3395319 RepID=UPI003EBF87E9